MVSTSDILGIGASSGSGASASPGAAGAGAGVSTCSAAVIAQEEGLLDDGPSDAQRATIMKIKNKACGPSASPTHENMKGIAYMALNHCWPCGRERARDVKEAKWGNKVRAHPST